MSEGLDRAAILELFEELSKRLDAKDARADLRRAAKDSNRSWRMSVCGKSAS